MIFQVARIGNKPQMAAGISGRRDVGVGGVSISRYVSKTHSDIMLTHITLSGYGCRLLLELDSCRERANTILLRRPRVASKALEYEDVREAH